MTVTKTSPIGIPASQSCSYLPPIPPPFVSSGDLREAMGAGADCCTDCGSGENSNKLFRYRVAINY